MPGIRITKPFKLGLLHRAYQYRGEQKLAVSALGMFSLTEPGRILPENELWRKAMGALGAGGMLDAAMPKSCGEFLVNGSFHAPGGKPVPAGFVRVKLGTLDKRINVYGDRHWKRAAGVSLGVSDPAPMGSMPLDFAHAFGGKEHKPNPLGMGMDALEAEGETRVPLPNLELPGALIGSPSDRPPPACYGMLDPMWPQRYAKVGTYDQQWLKERAPGLADDLEWGYFNVAAEDQWAKGFWRGDEEFELANLHPALPSITGRLPGLLARAFIMQGHGEEGRFMELPMRVDTVHFLPDEETAVCIWRADTRIATDDASDISQIMLAYERVKDPRRSLEHYREALRRRLDRETRAMLLLDERDLIPEGDKSGLAEIIERSGETSGRKGLLAQNQKGRLQSEKDKAQQRLAELGIDAGPALEALRMDPGQQSMNLEGLDISKLAAEARKQGEGARALAKQKVAELCQRAGLDADELLKKAEAVAALPRFSAAERIAQLKAALESTPGSEALLQKSVGAGGLPELEAKLKQGEDAFRKSYGMGAHVMVSGGLPAERRAGLAALREEVLRRVRRGESLLRMDLAGVDLSGADLKGADLSETYLEFADFSGADLSGARLKGAIAVRANFTGAKFAKTDFSSANVGKSSFVGATGAGADFRDAVLSEASFEDSAFPGASFGGGMMMNVNFTGADLSGADLAAPLFMDCRLDGVRLKGGGIRRAIVMGGSAAGIDLSEAKGETLLFVNVDLDRLKLSGAELAKLRLVGDQTHARGADFSGARVPGSNLRGIDLEGANFERAVLDGADLSEAKLKQARFRGASAVRAHFMKADLEAANLSNCKLKEAMFNKARLVQADLAGSNCFGAEFLGVTVGETRFHGANLKRTKLKDWHP
ncbi:MAG TPA: DUF2169 domain-containing protein [Gammaproteobacteria bacterium]|nr:DUF2169 domain-containing protein [Gammaproteobacteria bacterium]